MIALSPRTKAGRSGLVALLPKLHRERCILRLADLKVQRGTRKRAKHFELSVNTSLDAVVAGLRRQHGEDCWLYPPLVEGLRAIMAAPGAFDSDGGKGATTAAVRVHSFEVWDAASGALVAGELGYSVGLLYTSLSGFSEKNGAGSAQMAATGALLASADAELWDFGMVRKTAPPHATPSYYALKEEKEEKKKGRRRRRRRRKLWWVGSFKVSAR